MKFELLSNILNWILTVNFSVNEVLVRQGFERVVSDIPDRETKISKDNLLAFLEQVDNHLLGKILLQKIYNLHPAIRKEIWK